MVRANNKIVQYLCNSRRICFPPRTAIKPFPNHDMGLRLSRHYDIVITAVKRNRITRTINQNKARFLRLSKNKKKTENKSQRLYLVHR